MTEKKKTSIWMLFASGASVEVHANSYDAPAGSKRPINAYVVSDCDGDCEEAAARAVETVWQAVTIQGRRPKPMVLGFDLPGRKAKKPVVGASGGLAFVVSAMQKFTDFDFGYVAATGILQSTDLDAPILEVRSITEKLQAALHLVPQGGLVLYPESNDYEVLPSLKSKFKEKKIRLIAVVNVANALEVLVDDLPQKKRASRKLPKIILAAACGLLTVLLVFAGYQFALDQNGSPEKKEVLPQTEKLQNTPTVIAPAATTAPQPAEPAEQEVITISPDRAKVGNTDCDESDGDGLGDCLLDSEDIDPDTPLQLQQLHKQEEKNEQTSSLQPSKGFD